MFEGSSVNRRTVIKSTGAAGIFGLAGCVGGNGDGDGDGGGDGDGSGTATPTRGGSDSSAEIRFVLNPAEADVDIETQYRPMFDHIEAETGVTIDPVTTASYNATLQSLEGGRGDIADTSPFVPATAGDIADVVGVRVAFGASKYFSLVTTTPDENGVDSLEGIEGETVGFSDRLSVSGSLTPLLMLKEAGLDIGDAPDGDPNDFEMRNSDHTTAANQLINRAEVAAAGTGAFATASYVPQEQFDEMSEEFVELSSEYDSAGSATDEAELELLAVSDPLPRAPLMARADWDADVRADVESAILGATEEDLSHGEDYEGEELWFTGVEEGTVDDYQPIRDILEQLGLDPEEIAS